MPVVPVDEGPPSAVEPADPEYGRGPVRLEEMSPPRRSAADYALLLRRLTAAEATPPAAGTVVGRRHGQAARPPTIPSPAGPAL
ncbi:MAG TPA: hypothetical protein VHF92_02810 [Geodermatophilus sp.]|nr:hypothetical protein [Geodermatophilus sp.]